MLQKSDRNCSFATEEHLEQQRLEKVVPPDLNSSLKFVGESFVNMINAKNKNVLGASSKTYRQVSNAHSANEILASITRKSG